jgi:hypothetical protein
MSNASLFQHLVRDHRRSPHEIAGALSTQWQLHIFEHVESELGLLDLDHDHSA